LEVAAEDNCLAIGLRGNNVRFGSKANMCGAKANVPLSAKSGHPQKDLRDKERPPRGGLSEIRSGVLTKAAAMSALLLPTV
jgi:hypothetical protein